MNYRDYYEGLYRDYYRDPFHHSLLSTRELGFRVSASLQFTDRSTWAVCGLQILRCLQLILQVLHQLSIL